MCMARFFFVVVRWVFLFSFFIFLFIFSSQLIALRSMRLVLKGIKAANAQHTARGDTTGQKGQGTRTGCSQTDGQTDRQKSLLKATKRYSCHCPTVPRFFVAHCRSIRHCDSDCDCGIIAPSRTPST